MIGVPGYPLSAALTFDLFALPLLAESEGAAPPERQCSTWPPRSVTPATRA